MQDTFTSKCLAYLNQRLTTTQAEVIAGGDINGATITLTKPVLPLMERSRLHILDLREWVKSDFNSATARLCKGFELYHDQAIMTNAIRVFQDMGNVTAAIDSYLKRRPRCLKLGVLAQARLSVQHQLMSLPQADEAFLQQSQSDADAEKSSIARIRYEACLATATIYGTAVIYPVPNARQILRPLTDHLKPALFLLMNSAEDKNSNLMLWMIVLGGIAALDTSERPWFAKELAFYRHQREIRTVQAVEEIMEQFLWLRSACSIGAKLLWDEMPPL